MPLVNELKEQMKQALFAKDKPRLGTIRMAIAAVRQVEIDTRTTLSDEQVITVLTKMVKQRRDAKAQYEGAGRDDLAKIEAAEITVIETFLPAPLTEEELLSLVEQVCNQVQAVSMADMGKVMGALKSQVQGRCDMSQLSSMIRTKLQ